jgi:hypothetical protein
MEICPAFLLFFSAQRCYPLPSLCERPPNQIPPDPRLRSFINREIPEIREQERIFAYFAYFAVPFAFYVGMVLEPHIYAVSIEVCHC